ncbi:hypothetical protein [Microbacterium sp. gxy059]|uniref:hypothetical protein n=1 Tax=Microbacterium sp. gxy059 TaxID=2957199 RepID=UPI003D97D3C8
MPTMPLTLGPLHPPAWHRPFLRYFAPVDGDAAGAPSDEGSDEEPDDENPTPNADTDVSDDSEDEAPGEDDDELPSWARKSLKKANREAAAARLEAKKAREDAENEKKSLAQSIGKALGLVADEEETPTVDSLTTRLQERDTALSSAQVALQAQRAENAVLRYATKHKGDADALLDSRGFNEKLAAIDSTASDYATQVEALVKAEVDSNSRYRKVQVAPSSSNGAPPPAGGNNAPADDIESLRAEYRKTRGVAD